MNLKKRRLLGLIPLAILLIVILGLYFSGAFPTIDFETLKTEQVKYKAYATSHPILASLYFLLIYTLSAALLIPDAILLTLIGGLLFPLPLAILYACIGETLGGTLFFGIVRLACTSFRFIKKSKFLHKIEHQIHNEEIYYLLFFRLSHLLPFWLINFLSAILEVRFWTFLWTLFIGVLPFCIIFSEAGSGFSQYLNTHTSFHISEIFNTQLKITLAAISLCALIPIAIRRWRKKK